MKVANLVENALAEWPKCRNSDRYLMLVVWNNLGLKLTKEQRDLFMNLPSAETIRRIRQKFQENGKYLANQPVRETRQFKEHMLHADAPTATVERIEYIQEGML